MMNVETIREYCLSKKGATEAFPFDDNVLVFKVKKIFALVPLDSFENGEGSINLKCDPERAIELREEYSCIKGGYHMNKKHWNTIYLTECDIKPQLLKELIDHSYNLIFKSLTKKERESIS